MSDASLPPAAAEESVISTTLNSTLSEMLLWGLYTVVYIGTVYVYISRKSSKNRIVIGTISLSYIFYVVQVIIHWYETQLSVVAHSDTRDDLFIAMTFGAGWNIFVNDICTFSMAALADGLLIWRCLNVWDHSLRAILLPSLLLFCEIAVDLSIMIFQSVEHLNVSLDQGYAINKLLGASSFINLATTLTATLLIAYRINIVTEQDLSKKSRKFFMRIVEILVQSAAVYSVVTLAYAISVVVPYTPNNSVLVFAAQNYTYHFFIFVAGVAPTIMVARVAFIDDTNRGTSTFNNVSDLRFHVRSTLPNADQLESKWDRNDVENAGSSSFPGSQIFADK